jgi:hypothetical protein
MRGFSNFGLLKGTNFKRGTYFTGEDFNAMERKYANMPIETNVKKTMIKKEFEGG